MGPGIWFDQAMPDDTDPESAGRQIHIRLAPTANNIPGWPDYDPETTDPNQVRLALCQEGKHAIFLKKVEPHPVREPDAAVRESRHGPAE